MTHVRDARCPVNIYAHIAFFGLQRLAGMQPHAHARIDSFLPPVLSQGALDIHRGADRLSSAREGHEESISLGVDLVPAPASEGFPQDAALVCQQSRIPVAQLAE